MSFFRFSNEINPNFRACARFVELWKHRQNQRKHFLNNPYNFQNHIIITLFEDQNNDQYYDFHISPERNQQRICNL